MSNQGVKWFKQLFGVVLVLMGMSFLSPLAHAQLPSNMVVLTLHTAQASYTMSITTDGKVTRTQFPVKSKQVNANLYPPVDFDPITLDEEQVVELKRLISLVMAEKTALSVRARKFTPEDKFGSIVIYELAGGLLTGTILRDATIESSGGWFSKKKKELLVKRVISNAAQSIENQFLRPYLTDFYTDL